jgi:hypothetical protein
MLLLIILNGVPRVLDLVHDTGVHFKTHHVCKRGWRK